MAIDLGFLTQLSQQTIELQDASEHLLRKIAMNEIDRDDPSFDVVCNALGWDDRRRRQELRRMMHVIMHEKNACCDSEFVKRVEVADSLKVSNRKTRLKLEEKIASMRSEIAELDKQEKDAERSVEQAEVARAKLRELVPSHVKVVVDKEINRLNSQAENRRRLFLESEIRGLSGFAKNKIHPNSWVDTVRLRFPDAIRLNQHGIPYVAEWERIEKEAAEKLDAYKVEFAELDSKIRSEEESILGGLDYYIARD